MPYERLFPCCTAYMYLMHSQLPEDVLHSIYSALESQYEIYFVCAQYYRSCEDCVIIHMIYYSH